MRTAESTGIRIEDGRRDRAAGMTAARVFAALIVFIALAFWFCGGFRVRETGSGYLPVFIPGALLIAAFYLYISIRPAEKRGNREIVIICAVIAAVLAAAAILLRGALSEGAGIWADRFMDIRTELTGKIQKNYYPGTYPDIAGFSAGLISALFSLVMCGLALLFSETRRTAAAIAVCASVLIPLAARIAYPSWGIIAVCAALAAGSVIKAGLSSGGKRGIAGSVQGTIAFSALALILALATAVSGLGGLPYISGARSCVESLYHRTRYEERGNPMPEGDLTAMEPFEPSGRTSLVITMSEPEWTYLRGYVGESFDGTAWGPLPGENIRQQSDVFYGLHQSGFYGQSQESMAYDSAYGADAPAKGTMTVMNKSACGMYAYIPYGVSSEGTGILDPDGIGDTDVFARDGEPYSVNYTTAAVRNSYKLQQALAGEGIGSEYPRLEYAYRETVYDSYLYIPDSLRETFAKELGDAEQLSTTEAKIRVLEYLDRTVSYEPEAVIKDTDDVITAFLTDGEEGQSPHYATCAAMMLRYYGIPARYAEGFIVPGDLADSVLPGEPIEVKEEYAHAWTEYYLDGVGWIPFETTPGYRNGSMYAGTDDMEALAESGGGQNGAHLKKDEKDQKGTDQEIDNPANRKRRVFVFRKVWILFIALAALLVFAIITAIKRYRLAAFRKTFRDPDPRIGLDNAFAYAVMLISRRIKNVNRSDLSACAEDVQEAFGLGSEYKRAAALAARSLFSSLPVSEEERGSAVEFSKDILGRYKASRSAAGRLYDRLIKCIY